SSDGAAVVGECMSLLQEVVLATTGVHVPCQICESLKKQCIGISAAPEKGISGACSMHETQQMHHSGARADRGAPVPPDVGATLPASTARAANRMQRRVP